MFIDRRHISHFDFLLFFAVVLVCGLGCINLKSIGSFSADSTAVYFSKQLYWIILGCGCLLFVVCVDYQKILRSAYLFHSFSILLLVLVLFFGTAKYGSQRWLYIGGFTLQPSEIAKITFLCLLAHYFSQHMTRRIYTLRDMAVPLLLVCITVVPVFLQPDLGTAGIFFILFLCVFSFLRISRKAVFFFFSFLVLSIPAAWFFLKEYQRERVRFFINPELDPLNAGYQLIQSKIAIGSGGLMGKGYMQGTQSHLRFLPEQHTDFVFSVWAEEWGFLGCFFLLLIVFFIIYRGFSIAFSCKTFQGTFLALGITCLFFWQILINIFMTVGLFPVVGVPFPFFSYGGSAMITNFIGVGLLLNIGMRKIK